MDKTFAEKLKEARALTGLSQQGMSDRMLISKRTIEKWETGERVPPEYVQRFLLNELESMSIVERTARTLEERREEMLKVNSISEEKRKELLDLFASGAHPSEVFNAGLAQKLERMTKEKEPPVCLIWRDSQDDCATIEGYILGSDEADRYCAEHNKGCRYEWQELTWEELEELKTK